VKASLNPRGPSRKAKYSLATDSAPVARAKDEKNPDKGRNVNLKPHAYKRSELYEQCRVLSGEWRVKDRSPPGTKVPCGDLRFTRHSPLYTRHCSE
jgi:hypothetical protein